MNTGTDDCCMTKWILCTVAYEVVLLLVIYNQIKSTTFRYNRLLGIMDSGCTFVPYTAREVYNIEMMYGLAFT